jgi:N-carbamoylputrescine amidase
MTDPIRLAGIQMAMGRDRAENLRRAISLVEQATSQGAQLVALPELFSAPYFPRLPHVPDYLEWAEPVPGPTTEALCELAGRLKVTLIGSVYERAMAGLTYNTAVVCGSDGSLAGKSRKAHIPDSAGYAEKFYFAPGDSDYPVFDLPVGGGRLTVGLATCWDQWFPEVARILALKGAELIVYPTAIGSEPASPELDTHDAWRTVMRGHAVANALYVLAVNRVGVEADITFYGGSFLADPLGLVLAEAGPDETLLQARLDLSAIARTRGVQTFFRDRRPETYAALLGRGGR